MSCSSRTRSDVGPRGGGLARRAPGARRLALVMLALAAAGEAAAAPADRPLGVATAGPLRALFLDMPLADARGSAAAAFDLRWSVQNSWSTPTTVLRDGKVVEVQLDAQVETLQLAVALPWQVLSGGGLAGRLTTTLEARALAVWGGWTDGGIEGWHGLVDTTNFEREQFPRDRVALRLAEVGGPRLVDARSGRLALGDVVLRNALRVVGAGPLGPPSRLTLALRADLKLPTGSPGRLGGSGGVDAGAGLAATFLATRWLTAHALASVRATSGLPRGVALQPRSLQAGLDLSLAARIGRVTVLLEDRVASPLFESGWRLPPGQEDASSSAWYALFRPHNQVSVGLRWREVTAFFSEDFTPGDRLEIDTSADWFYESNAPDVVFGLAWARDL